MHHEKPDSLSINGASNITASAMPARVFNGFAATVTRVDRWLVTKLMQAIGAPPVEMCLWDEEPVYRPAGRAVARVTFRDRGALLRVVLAPELGFGDCYSAGRIRVEGDLVDFIQSIYRAGQTATGPFLKALVSWLNQPRRNGLFESRDNISHHYDLSNAFYRLWLDRRMVYTCAYYPHPDSTLEQAQLAKLDHVSRKLRLEPGQTVVEAGCGWGALALHMAEHYGVRVKAYNISREQIAYARARAEAEGLADRVEFIEDDYRNIRGSFDRFVSVGMLEHVGVDRYADLGRVIAGCLKDTGLGLIHTIGRNRPQPMHVWIEKRIFPGSYPPSLGEMAGIFEPQGYSILDVENLRLHYARTCGDWLSRFDAAADEVERMSDASFVRAWRLYLAGSTAAFTAGVLQLFQVVFAPPGNNRVPWTREHLYHGADRQG